MYWGTMLMIFIVIGFAITFASRALTRLAANSLHKTLKYKHTFTYKRMFLTVGIQAHTLILGIHVQCIGDYCASSGGL